MVGFGGRRERGATASVRRTDLGRKNRVGGDAYPPGRWAAASGRAATRTKRPAPTLGHIVPVVGRDRDDNRAVHARLRRARSPRRRAPRPTRRRRWPLRRADPARCARPSSGPCAARPEQRVGQDSTTNWRRCSRPTTTSSPSAPMSRCCSPAGGGAFRRPRRRAPSFRAGGVVLLLPTVCPGSVRRSFRQVQVAEAVAGGEFTGVHVDRVFLGGGGHDALVTLWIRSAPCDASAVPSWWQEGLIEAKR